MSTFFKAPYALVESTQVGRGTRIESFTRIMAGAVIGEECSIAENVFIEDGVRVGNGVNIKNSVQLWSGTRIGDKAIIGPNATFANGGGFGAKAGSSEQPTIVVEQGATIGANATILSGVTIGHNAIIGAGSVVTRNVPPNAIVVGNPARLVRYAGTVSPQPSAPQVSAATVNSVNIAVRDVQLLHVPLIHDLRGNLSARQFGKGLPFIPERYFVIVDVPSKEVRGEHAHRVCKQFLVCLKGSVAVLCDDGRSRQEFVLDSLEVGLYLPPMVWGVQYKYTKDAMLLVLASHGYDAGDYIRDYSRFLEERAAFDTSGGS